MIEKPPVAILAVPATGDPGRLLSNGDALPFRDVNGISITSTRSGSPPRVTLFRMSAPLQDRIGPSTLPLWWDNKLVADGWDRAYRLVSLQTAPGIPQRHPNVEQVLAFAALLVEQGFTAGVVLLDLVDGPNGLGLRERAG